MNSLFSTKTNIPFEAIIIDDQSTDGCCNFIKEYKNNKHINLIQTAGVGAAKARNIGSDHAQWRFLIFCDAHLTFEDWWIDLLIQPILDNRSDVVAPAIADSQFPESIGYGQTLTPTLSVKWNKKQNHLFETAIVPGGCFAISRSVFSQINGFEQSNRTWGYEDIELSIRLWLFGFRCHVEPKVTIFHLFRQVHPYKVPSSDVYYNYLRMAYLHFNEQRIRKCKEVFKHRRARQIESQLLSDGVMSQRANFFNKRKYGDDWYFKKFNIEF